MDKKPKVVGDNPKKARRNPSAGIVKSSKGNKGKMKTYSDNPGYHY